jgi:hypothetical protein
MLPLNRSSEEYVGHNEFVMDIDGHHSEIGWKIAKTNIFIHGGSNPVLSL